MESGFWNFSLTVYGAPGVKDACLELQDRFGLDVNLVLFCCWTGSRSVPISPEQWKAILSLTLTLQGEAIEPIRSLRRNAGRASPDAERLYKTLLALELSAEKTEQRLLQQFADENLAPGPGPTCIDKNLLGYLSGLESDPDGKLMESFGVIARASGSESR